MASLSNAATFYIEPIRDAAMMDDETLFDAWVDAATELSRNRCEDIESARGSRAVEAALRTALINRLALYGMVHSTDKKPLPPVTRRPG